MLQNDMPEDYIINNLLRLRYLEMIHYVKID